MTSSSLAPRGRVVGIDVGYSARRATTGFCAITWDAGEVDWTWANARTCVADRTRVLDAVLAGGDRAVAAVAVDGPLRPDLDYAPTYRCAERLLSCGSFQRRGKPGPTSGGSGPALHAEATALTRFALATLLIDAAAYAARIHRRAVMEAFPNLFLGVLCDEDCYPVPARPRQWTDALYDAVRPRLEALLRHLLPGRAIRGDWDIGDHDGIASFVCALSALCVAAGRYVAVGAHADGFIMLPPHDAWGRDAWAERELRTNVARHGGGVIYRDDVVWMRGNGAGCNDATPMGGNGAACKDATRMGGNGAAVQPPHSS